VSVIVSRSNRRPASSVVDLRTERRLVGAAVVAALASVVTWLSAGLACALSGNGLHDVAPRAALGLLFGVLAHPGDPKRAFPARLRGDVPGADAFWAVACGVVAAMSAATYAASKVATRARGPNPAPRSSTGWATRAELGALLVKRSDKGRLVVGRFGRSLVATEPGHSLLVIGPTQSGKTTGLAIPAILDWQGPVLATSVKSDLVRVTASHRAQRGSVFVFDPARVSGHDRASWSPLTPAVTWLGARRVAASLCSLQREAGRSPEDAAFWGALAEKLLAPMLFAAARQNGSMLDVVAWIDTGEVAEILDVLDAIGEGEALRCARVSFGREERQLASVYSTAEAAVTAFADPLVESGDGGAIDAANFALRGSGTCYLVAPAHEQERLRPVFVALLREVIDGAFLSASRHGRLDPPLLVVLDEAANIAPVANLDALASTSASHGIQLVTIWQDFAQITTRYGNRAATVVNNHRAKLVFPGVSDPDTLAQFSALIGDEIVATETVTSDVSGAVSSTRGEGERRLVTAAGLRTLARGEAVLLYGCLPPVRVTIRDRLAPPRGAIGCLGRVLSPSRRARGKSRRRA
jgi:type IV secretion system protein VirD4